MRCPFCDSKRVTDYTTRKKCRACGKLYTITVKEVVPEICYKCERPIFEPCQAGRDGKRENKTYQMQEDRIGGLYACGLVFRRGSDRRSDLVRTPGRLRCRNYIMARQTISISPKRRSTPT